MADRCARCGCCATCHGDAWIGGGDCFDGDDPNDPARPCPDCHGTGRVAEASAKPEEPGAAPPLDLDAIERRAKRATPGPWRIGPDYCGGQRDVNAPAADEKVTHATWPPDAVFIAAAREDVPALVSRVRELETERRLLRANLYGRLDQAEDLAEAARWIEYARGVITRLSGGRIGVTPEKEARRRRVCPTCEEPRVYSPQYDAYACMRCNVWLESNCEDPKCCYCAGRPEVPT